MSREGLRTCLFCGRAFALDPRAPHQIYCSHNCGSKQRRAIARLKNTSTQLVFDSTSRFLVVGLEPGLDRSRITGIFASIRSLPGIDFVADMSVISRGTLDALLLPNGAAH